VHAPKKEEQQCLLLCRESLKEEECAVQSRYKDFVESASRVHRKEEEYLESDARPPLFKLDETKFAVAK